MVVKRIKELYNVDTISQDKGWKKVNDALPENETIMIDFTGTNIVDPWDCSEFKKLLKNPLVHMKFTNCDEMVRRLKIMCVVEGLDESRIINEVIEIPREKTAEEKKVERIGESLIPLFEIDGNKAKFKVSTKYSQIHSTNTINYIEYAIERLVNDYEIKEIILDINGVSILKNVVESMADLVVGYRKSDIDICVDISDEESINNMKLFIHQATTKAYNAEEREKALNKHLKKNTAGILIKYKKSKALDEFGRHGNGEVVSSRIALFKKIEVVDGRTVAVIESYNNNYFYTKQHWMVEHDNEMLSKLTYETLNIDMNELGYGDLFLGSTYHFMAPVQQNINENRVVIKELNENGSNVKVTCTIPERIKLVFDDWGIDYDEGELDKAIVATRETLHI